MLSFYFIALCVSYLFDPVVGSFVTKIKHYHEVKNKTAVQSENSLKIPYFSKNSFDISYTFDSNKESKYSFSDGCFKIESERSTQSINFSNCKSGTMSQNGSQVTIHKDTVSIHFKELCLFTYIKNFGYLKLRLELKTLDQKIIHSNTLIKKMQNVKLTREVSNQYTIDRLDQNKGGLIEFFNNNEFKTINI